MRTIILHGHIFKNAGTTFDWTLRKNFGERFFDHREDQLMREDGREHLAQLVGAKRDLCAISSHHMTRDFPALPDVRFIPVYFLRHPLARMRSVYDFERAQQADTPGAVAASSKTFREYVAWRMRADVRPTIRNYQVLYLSGQHELVSQKEVASSCFPAALENLGTDALVGVVERFDESIVVLEEALRQWYPQIDLSYVAQNVSGSKRREENIEHRVANVLADLGALQQQAIDENSFDLAMYQMACAQLQSRIDSIDDFPAKLQAFRSRRQ